MAVPGSAVQGRALTIALRAPVLPRYMARREVVRLEQESRMKAAQNDWWGEPLGDMVRRVLTADLAQRLPAAQVLGSDGIAGDAATAEIETEFEQFDADPSGRIVLSGFAGIVPAGQTRHLMRVQAQADASAPTVDARVAAMSTALGQIADQIAAAVSRAPAL